MSKNNSKILNIKIQEGFSLVEMLVAVGIFMSIMTLAVSALISIVGANKKAQLIKSTMDSITFAVEDISRDMRTGTNYSCSTDGGAHYVGDCTMGGTAVQYKNNVGKQITYTFNGSSDPLKGILTRTDGSTGNTTDLISQGSNVNITNMEFYVIGANCQFGGSCTPKTQPRVIITISGRISVKGSTDTEFNLQTNISQRARS